MIANSIRMHRNKAQTTLGYMVYYCQVVILLCIGLFSSIYLFYSHYKNYTDLTYSSFCALSRSINCDTVSQSPYSVFIGLPVSIWGLIGYIFLLILIIFAAYPKSDKKKCWHLFFLVSLVYSSISLFLGAVSYLYIKSYCIVCITTYAVNFFLLFYTYIIRKRFELTGLLSGIKADIIYLSKRKLFLICFAALVLSVAGLKMYLPEYWLYKTDGTVANIKKGITDSGDPWIGAEEPILTVTEYSDYMCFQCYKMHSYLRKIIEANPDKIRLLHRNFPLDNEINPYLVKDSYHVGSAKLSLISVYSSSREDFWQINDKLYEIGREKGEYSAEDMAKRIGLTTDQVVNALTDDVVKKNLSWDIYQGLKKKITATPSYVIDEEVYIGNIPIDKLNSMLDSD